MSQSTIGIDFGVTTTVAAFAGESEVALVTDADGKSVFPSVIAFSPTGDDIVGDGAKERRIIDPANTLFSVKRIIGESWNSSAVKHFVDQYPFFPLERHDDNLPRFATRKGLLTAVEVSSRILAYVRELALRESEGPHHAVVGVPSSYSERQRKATIDAVKAAGFEDALCVAEPLAIARACVRDDRDLAGTIAIYDLGGGTFDLAICEIRKGAVRLLAAGGDEYLGGDDIDRLLADWVVGQVLRRHQWDIRTSPEAMVRLLAECERVKIALSAEEGAAVQLRAVEETELLPDEVVEVEQQLLEELSTDLVRRTFTACDDVLSKAGVTVDAVDAVYLAGGSTQIPFVQRAVERYFSIRLLFN